MSLQKYCEQELEAYRKLKANSKSISFKEWFNNNAKLFTKVNEKKSLKLSKRDNCQVKQCYRNTWIATCVNKELKYYEGLVVSDDVPIPIPHSWLVDTDGQIIDPTLIINGKRLEQQLHQEYGVKSKERESRLGDEYYGVEIPLDFVNKMTLKHKITGEWIIKFFEQELDQVGRGKK